jgi:hypothetical protein
MQRRKNFWPFSEICTAKLGYSSIWQGPSTWLYLRQCVAPAFYSEQVLTTTEGGGGEGGPKVFQQYKTPLGNIQLAAVEESFFHAYMALKSSDVNDIASMIRNKKLLQKLKMIG